MKDGVVPDVADIVTRSISLGNIVFCLSHVTLTDTLSLTAVFRVIILQTTDTFVPAYEGESVRESMISGVGTKQR